jgi:hypothetical protein
MTNYGLIGYCNPLSVHSWITNTTSSPILQTGERLKSSQEASSGIGSHAQTIKDKAAFDRDALMAIYGESPSCFICPTYRAQHYHHNFKRQAGDKDTREIMSSVFNAVPLSADIHTHCPFLSNPSFQGVLLSHSIRHVNHAVAKGYYAVTQNDIEFLNWVQTTTECLTSSL